MNISMLLEMAVDGFGDRLIIGRREGGLTTESLDSLASGGAGLIQTAGADSVLYLAINGPAFPVALFAAARAGVPLVPVNYRLGTEQLRQLVQRHPKALVLADDGQMDVVRDAGIRICTPAQFLTEAGDAKPSPQGWDDPSSAAVIIYTSGTTSTPKGVVLRHENLTSYVMGSVEFGSADSDEAALVSVPPYHIAAVSNTLTNLYAGRRAIVLEPFVPSHWVGTVRDENVTHAMVVPTMLARIMDEDGLDRSVPSLRSLAYGGAAMPRRVIEQALTEWPHVGFVNAYGLTETSSTITVLGPEEHRRAISSKDPAFRSRLTSAGCPVPGVELEIRLDDGTVADPGVTGLVWVRGDQIATEYSGMGSTLDAEGWFCTRDRGRCDAEGYIYIEGRVDDTIIRGAENIAPAEIETVLLRHDRVADAVVVGVPDEEWGQRIEAVVVPRNADPLDETELEDVRALVRATLRGSKTPDRVVCWPELPRTPTGKLLRREVVAKLVDTIL